MPYFEPEEKSIWVDVEFPALELNPNITRVICIDVRDNTSTQVIFDRAWGMQGPGGGTKVGAQCYPVLKDNSPAKTYYSSAASWSRT